MVFCRVLLMNDNLCICSTFTTAHSNEKSTVKPPCRRKGMHRQFQMLVGDFKKLLTHTIPDIGRRFQKIIDQWFQTLLVGYIKNIIWDSKTLLAKDFKTLIIGDSKTLLIGYFKNIISKIFQNIIDRIFQKHYWS